jgi:hypothetical protein
MRIRVHHTGFNLTKVISWSHLIPPPCFWAYRCILKCYGHSRTFTSICVSDTSNKSCYIAGGHENKSSVWSWKPAQHWHCRSERSPALDSCWSHSVINMEDRPFTLMFYSVIFLKNRRYWVGEAIWVRETVCMYDSFWPGYSVFSGVQYKDRFLNRILYDCRRPI